jgi:hypothetical protein
VVKSEISIQVANPVKYRIIGFISVFAVLLYGLAVSASQDPNLPPRGSTQNTGPQSTATPNDNAHYFSEAKTNVFRSLERSILWLLKRARFQKTGVISPDFRPWY